MMKSKRKEEWREDYAVEQYRKGEFSFGQLAKFAGISVWDVPTLLKEKEVYLNYVKMLAKTPPLKNFQFLTAIKNCKFLRF